MKENEKTPKEKENLETPPLQNDQNEIVPEKDSSVEEAEELADMLENVPEDVRGGMLQMILQGHSGPLPSPESLSAYEQICPGAAERILIMAEKEQAHRHRGDEKVIFTRPNRIKRGQLFAFFTCLATIAGAIAMGIVGQTTVAVALAAGPPILLAGGFIGYRISWKKKQKSAEGENSEDADK